MKTNKKADPMKTKTGKTRLGPLSVTQLNDLLDKTSKNKTKARIKRRIWELEHRKGYAAPIAEKVEETQ